MTGYECEECTRIWPVQSAAETCAEQDLLDQDTYSPSRNRISYILGYD